MRLLAIDTTEQACSAALAVDGEIRERFEVAPRRHSRLLLPMVDALLAEAGLALGRLDGLAFARGPGAFTGIRVAAATAQGLAMAADLPVLPVSSLLALGRGVLSTVEEDRVLAVFDARMGEVYALCCGRDAAGGAVPLDEERVCPPESLALPEGFRGVIAGSGAPLCGNLPGETRRLPDAMVHARDVAALAAPALAAGAGLPAERAQPVYLRDRVAEKPAPVS